MKKLGVWFIILATLFLTGCSLFTPKKGILEVEVVLMDNTPVKELELKLVEGTKEIGTAITDTKGKAQFEAKATKYKIVGSIALINGKKYSIDESVEIVAKKTASKQIKVDKLALLTVTVVDANNNPLQGADIVLKDNTKELATVKADSKGSANFFLESGITYRLNCKYSELTLSEDVTFLAEKSQIEKTLKLDFYVPVNLARGKNYRLNLAPAGDYNDSGGELTDGVYGEKDIFAAPWQGINGFEINFIVVVDLEKSYKTLDFATINALRDSDSGVHIPTKVDLAVSEDGVIWNLVEAKDFTNLIPADPLLAFKYQIDIDKPARFVAYQMPMRYWLFIDEIEVVGNPGSGVNASGDLAAIDLTKIFSM